MFKVKEKIKKAFSVGGIVFLVLVQLFPLGAHAATLSVSDSLLETTGAINRADNQTAEVSNKQQGPKVEVTFGADGAMKNGARVTATAVPSSFNNASNPKELYFTWYLKREGCDKDSGNLSKCDEDGNGKINENDWKIAAAKIIVKGSFDNTDVKYSGSYIDNSSYKASPSPLSDWQIGYGQDSNDKDATNCYVQEQDTGLIFELRDVSENLDSCPDVDNVKYERACVDKVPTSCDVLNSAYQTAVVAGAPFPTPMPENSIKKNTDLCGVVTKSDSAMSCDIADYTNYKTELSCNEKTQIPICVPADNSRIKITDSSDKISKINGNIFGMNDFALTAGSTSRKDPQVCSEIYDPNTNTLSSPSVPLPTAPDALIPPSAPNFFESVQASFNTANTNQNCNDLTSAWVNGTKNVDGTDANTPNIKRAPTCSFEKDVNLCKHLFPVITNKVQGAHIGDGKFSMAEKEFWGADPNVSSTNGIQKDEEALTGLGVDKFSWIYSVGDQVGVVVEGDSDMPTSHNDNSFKRMWAFSNNKCNELKGLSDDNNLVTDGGSDKNNSGFYFEKNGNSCNPVTDSNCPGILTTDVDLNKCLEENLLDPDVDNLYGLKVQISAMPTNPVNDANGGGDILKIVSGATNTDNPESLLYSWSIQKSRDGSNAPIDTTNWQDITFDLKTEGSVVEADLAGLGKKELNVKLNLHEDIIKAGMNQSSYKEGDSFYLRIKVKITGGAVDGSQNAQGTVDVRVGQQQNEIRRYSVLANNAGSLTLNNGNSNAIICGDQAGKSTCYVTKNEIIGLIVPTNAKSSGTPFSWTVNGNDISCKASSQCSTGNVLFFPIIGNVGEAVDIVAKGINKNGEAIEISRHFVIVEPKTGITSLDWLSSWPKLLGYYKYLNGSKSPDYSTQVMETNSGKVVTLGAEVYPAWKAGQAGFDWAIDGQIIPEFSNQNQIKLSVEKFPGESYNIGLVANITPGSADQINNIRLALSKNWGIAVEDVVEEKSNANIQLNVIEGGSQVVASAKKNFFGASLITHLPEQLMFLLKISLTSIGLFLLTGVLFAIIPERVFAKEK